MLRRRIPFVLPSMVTHALTKIAQDRTKGMTAKSSSAIEIDMTHSAANFYFWYFGYPMPLAEDGTRMI